MMIILPAIAGLAITTSGWQGSPLTHTGAILSAKGWPVLRLGDWRQRDAECQRNQKLHDLSPVTSSSFSRCTL
jgi:hypothetical protein